MPLEHLVHRYAAYYFGWCQAFGEHQVFEGDELLHTQWLVSDDAVGMILPPRTRRALLRDLLASAGRRAHIHLDSKAHSLCVNDAYHDITSQDSRGVDKLVELVDHSDDLHLFLTHHIMYASGTRIITFARKKPLIIMYKEVDPVILTVA